MNEKKVVKENRADAWRRQINQFSIGMLIALIGLFVFEMLSQRTNDFYAQTQIDAVQDLMVLDNAVTEIAITLNSQGNTPLAETTATAQDTAVTPTGQSRTATNTNESVPDTTSLSTDALELTSANASGASTDSHTSATPASTNVVGSPAENRTYYVIISANIRPCPYITNDCDVTESLTKGTALSVTGEVNGDNFQGSTLWYSLERNGKTAFIHSSLVSTTPSAP